MTRNHDIDEVIKTNSGRILGYLIRLVGNFDDAEDLLQDVLEKALVDWRKRGLPAEPLAWLFLAARNRTIDLFRRRRTAEKHQTEIVNEPEVVQELTEYLQDDLLRLLFICSHPSLNEDVRVALTLRSVVGFNLEEVARAFLISTTAMEQRLVRAKRKIKLAGIPFDLPSPRQMKQRLTSVLQTVYLMFNEGYSATSGEELIVTSFCDEAIELGKLLVDLFPKNAEVQSMLALMLLQDSRRSARVSKTGALVLLKDQHRESWNHDKIELGQHCLDTALALKDSPEPFQLQAIIAALLVSSDSFETIDWNEIGLAYEFLLKDATVNNGPAVFWLNYAVVLSMQGEVQAGLALIGQLESQLINYHPYYLARAELCERAIAAGILPTKKQSNVRDDLERAYGLAKNSTEKQFLRNKINQRIELND